MQIKVTRIEDGPARVEVIDPSDGAVTHTADVNVGEQVVVNANGCHTPADIEVCAVEPTPEPEAEVAETGEAEAGTGDGGSGEAPEGESGESGDGEGESQAAA